MYNNSVGQGNSEMLHLSDSHIVESLSWTQLSRNIVTIFPYVGGKHGLVPSIVPIIEWAVKQYKLDVYIEATAGGARCLLNLDIKLFKHRILNEVDYSLCKLYAVLADELLIQDLINKLYRQDFNESVFNAALTARNKDFYLEENDRYEETSDYLTAAYNTFIVLLFSRAAGMKVYDGFTARRKMGGYYNRVLKLNQFLPILSDVEILRSDCRQLIKKYYYESRYFCYIDPPYDPNEMRGKKHYKNSWTVEVHLAFRELIRDARMCIAISSYASDIYDGLNWTKLYLKDKHVAISGKSIMVAEYLYINFSVTDELLAKIRATRITE